MAPGSRSRPPSLRRQSQPIYPLPAIIEDVAAVAADAPVVPERSPRRTRPASLPALLSSQHGGGLSRNSSTASSRAASERGPSPLTIGNAGSASGAPDGAVKTGTPRRHDPERHRVMNRMAKRGGWYKLILISILLAGIIIGLGVGLTLGLRKRNDRTPPPPLPVDLFPAGLYAFTTALTNISTECLPSSSRTNAWHCVGGPNTFNASQPSADPNLSSTTYHWIIEPTSPFSYVISSSPAPNDSQSSLDQGATTLPTFTNLSLTLHDANQATERFTFSFTMPKSVRIEIPLNSSSNASFSSEIPAKTINGLDTRRLARRQQQLQEYKQRQITCFFNTTTMSATIWTRMRASFPQNITNLPTPVNASRASFAPWPFRVEITEVELGSDLKSTGGMPDCRDSGGKVVPLSRLVARDNGDLDNSVDVRRWVDGIFRIKTRGIFSRQVEEVKSKECSCRYANYELESTRTATVGSNQGPSSGLPSATSHSIPTPTTITRSAVG